VHGRYVRKLRDVAAGVLGVVIELCIRRFRCENPACTAVPFAEHIAGLTAPHSRYTPLLREVLTQLGLAGQELSAYKRMWLWQDFRRRRSSRQ
jgi:hypothetical protein